MADRPLVLAHRGASWDAAENTLEAFELAIAQGADYVELDVRRAPGGTLVVTHDPVARRTPAMPTLDDTLESLRGRIGLAVEIKEPETTGDVLAALRRHRIDADNLLLLSGRIRALDAVARRRRDVRCVLHLGRSPDPVAATAFWGVGFHDRTAGPRQLALAHSLGLATTVFTINDASRMRSLVGLRVDGIFTDRPRLLREVLAELATAR